LRDDHEDTPEKRCDAGKLGKQRPGPPLVAAYDEIERQAIVITVYQPDPGKWEGYRRRKQ
jgi:hypothetical protein